MSAKGRGPHSGGPNDFFETPAWCVDLVAPHLNLHKARKILEPCAGNGAIIRALSRHRMGIKWGAVDIREVCRNPLASTGAAVEICDYLCTGFCFVADLVVTNPPFSLAQEFVERALETQPGAVVAMLLRVAFLASEERSDLLRRYPPDVLIIPNRPSFTANGNTDQTDYGWFIWPAGEERKRTKGNVWVADTTPLSVRRPPKGTKQLGLGL